MIWVRELYFIIRFFLPPKATDPEEAQLNWRYKVASSLAFLIIFLAGLILVSLGQLPFMSQGFASVTQEDEKHRVIMVSVNDNKRQIDEIRGGFKDMRRDQLDTRLYDTRDRQCDAQTTKNTAAFRSEGLRLFEDMIKYRNLTGRDWRVPPCTEY